MLIFDKVQKKVSDLNESQQRIPPVLRTLQLRLEMALAESGKKYLTDDKAKPIVVKLIREVESDKQLSPDKPKKQEMCDEKIAMLKAFI